MMYVVQEDSFARTGSIIKHRACEDLGSRKLQLVCQSCCQKKHEQPKDV